MSDEMSYHKRRSEVPSSPTGAPPPINELPPAPAGVPLQIRDWRKAYLNMKEPFLKEEAMLEDPFLQFDLWFKDVSERKDMSFEEVNAVCLSTCRDNRPSSRMVLMKQYDPEGYSFYSNDSSRKGQDIAANPNGAMLFYWPAVSRQVRIEGVIEKLPTSAADEYWASRPIHSRIGSKASAQGTVVPSREVLEAEKARLEKVAATEGEKAITRPPSWIGFILKPTYYEFWQGQSNRLHDRIIYNLVIDGEKKTWVRHRLAP
uniref:pyridoxal 5'-phosphate synthase n=1 Tax=Panagrellus redivivus TaxID=6233 RepID=A0A7E4ZSL8_PANRE